MISWIEMKTKLPDDYDAFKQPRKIQPEEECTAVGKRVREKLNSMLIFPRELVPTDLADSTVPGSAQSARVPATGHEVTDSLAIQQQDSCA